MLKKLIASITIIAALLMVSSCRDLLDTQPAQSVDPDAALENIAGVEAIVTSMYNRMIQEHRYGQRLILAPEILADNTRLHPDPSGRYNSESTNQIGSHISLIGNNEETLWYNAYQTINEANYVIDGVDQTETTPENRDRLLGESLFVRALAYHDLARTYAYEPNQVVGGWEQGVIIRTTPTTDVLEADHRARESITAVYERIEEDLLDAIDLLEGNDRGEVGYATHAAANAALARVYLYWEDWENAIDYATEAMEASGLSLVDPENYEGVFGSDVNPEAILELQVDNTTSLGVNTAIAAVTTPDQWYDVIPSPELLDLFLEEDVRWADFDLDPDEAFMYSTKYEQHQETWADNIPLIRYSEMLLIRAESYYELGQESIALDDLETLRTARGLTGWDPVLNPPPAGESLLQTIMEERQRELNFEGHRWFDLKRKGMDITKPAVTGLTSISYNDFRILAPIPSNQVDNVEPLEQNPQY